MTEKNEGLSRKDEHYDYAVKIVLVGDSAVGKSNLLSRFLENQFCSNSEPTIGVELASKLVKIDDKIVKAQIWDSAGLEQYRTPIGPYYRDTVGAIFVYDVTQWSTFENIMNKWLKEVSDNTRYNIIKILVANKTDLRERVVAIEDGVTLADGHRLFKYIETSSLDSTNVEKLFRVLLSEICRCVGFGWLKPLVEESENEEGNLYMQYV